MVDVADEGPNLGILLFIPYRFLETAVADALKAHGHDLPLSQARVFQRIAPEGSRLAELAEAAQLPKQTVGSIVDQLERAGYVRREPDPRDARARLVTITTRGRELVEISLPVVREVEAQWRAHLGPARYRQLTEALTALREITDPFLPRPVRVRIVNLNGPTFDALALGDLEAANAASPVSLPSYFAGPDWRGVWQMRSRQVADDPASAAWVTGVIWDEEQHLAVGRAGFHGPPDAAGAVEIGYAVDPAHRRRGYARAALETLLQRAAGEPQVHTVRVSVSPGNQASNALISQYGFVEVGEQWDEEDGLEIVYERPARQP